MLTRGLNCAFSLFPDDREKSLSIFCFNEGTHSLFCAFNSKSQEIWAVRVKKTSNSLTPEFMRLTDKRKKSTLCACPNSFILIKEVEKWSLKS